MVADKPPSAVQFDSPPRVHVTHPRIQIGGVRAHRHNKHVRESGSEPTGGGVTVRIANAA